MEYKANYYVNISGNNKVVEETTKGKIQEAGI